MKLQGILPALTTPFAADGTVALQKLRENVSRYNATGVTGFLSVGSTGESVLLSFSEVERVWGATREAAAPGKILIAGTGVDGTAETIERTRRAAALGFDAALVKTPHYFKPQMTAGALEAHYGQVADASPIPVLIYSVPQYTGVAVTSDLVARLAQHPNIAGIKDSSGNVQLTGEIVNSTPIGFRTMVGSASTVLAALAVGAAGGILALACFLPQAAVGIYEAFAANDLAQATLLQRSILTASRKIVAQFGIAGIKYAMDCNGYYGGAPRLPLQPLDEAQRKQVEGVLAEAVPAPAAQTN